MAQTFRESWPTWTQPASGQMVLCGWSATSSWYLQFVKTSSLLCRRIWSINLLSISRTYISQFRRRNLLPTTLENKFNFFGMKQEHLFFRIINIYPKNMFSNWPKPFFFSSHLIQWKHSGLKVPTKKVKPEGKVYMYKGSSIRPRLWINN